MRFPIGHQIVDKRQIGGDITNTFWGWRAHILPFVEQNNVHEEFDFTARPVEINLHTTEIPSFVCPSDPDINKTFVIQFGVLCSQSNHVGCGGSVEQSYIPFLDYYDGVLTQARDSRSHGRAMRDISDGKSSTFLFGETKGTTTWPSGIHTPFRVQIR